MYIASVDGFLIVSLMSGQFVGHLVGIVQFLQSSFVCTEINTFGIKWFYVFLKFKYLQQILAK